MDDASELLCLVSRMFKYICKTFYHPIKGIYIIVIYYQIGIIPNIGKFISEVYFFLDCYFFVPGYFAR